MTNRRDSIVKAMNKASIEPSDDAIDIVANQLDYMGIEEPTDAQAEEAISRGMECKRRGADKAARLKTEREKSEAAAIKLRDERQKQRDENRRIQAERQKGKDATP